MDPLRVEADREAVTSFYAAHPLLFDGTRWSVSVAAWLYDIESIFHVCHIEAHLQVSLAVRCLISDARLWWMTIGERHMPSRTWAHFRAALLARYGPLPAQAVDGQYRDPEIYRDMLHTRYHGFVADWHAYPHESMGHYCQRFQEAMLPYIPQDIPSPELQALTILRNGVPPPIRQFVPMPMPGRTVSTMIDDVLEAEVVAHMMQAGDHVDEHQVPVDDAGLGEHQYEVGPLFPEDPIPAVPVQEVPAQEAEDPMDAEDDADDDVVQIDPPPPADPPVIDISSDEEDEEEDAEPEHEAEDEHEDDPVEIVLDQGDEFDDDPEEILYHDGEWIPDSDAESDASSAVTLEIVV